MKKYFDLTIVYLDPHTMNNIDLEFTKMTKKEMLKQVKLMMKSYVVLSVKWEPSKGDLL